MGLAADVRRILRAGILLSVVTAFFCSPINARETLDPKPVISCSTGMSAEICAVPLPPTRAAVLEKEQKNFVVRQDGDFLDVVFRHSEDDYLFNHAPYLCCDIQLSLSPIGKGLWGTRIHVRQFDKAVLSLGIANLASEARDVVSFAGPSSGRRALPVSPVSRSDVREIVVHSRALGADRSIYVYRGTQCRQTLNMCRVIYFADGEAIGSTFLQNEPANVPALLAQLVLVGLGSAPHDEMGARRILELLASHHDRAFTQFEDFLVKEVIPKIEQGSKPEGRYVGGFSNGGSWALNMMLRHPDLFQGALAFSTADWSPPPSGSAAGKLVWLGGGSLEGATLKHTQELRNLQARVETCLLVGGHSPNTWNGLFWWALPQLAADRPVPQ